MITFFFLLLFSFFIAFIFLFFKKLLVLLSLEFAMVVYIGFYFSFFCYSVFSLVVLLFLFVFMVLDSVIGMVVLISSSRNSTFFGFCFYNF